MSILDTGPIELSVALHAIPGRVLVSNVLSCQPPVNADDTKEVIYGETANYNLKPSVPGINITLLYYSSTARV